MLLQFTNILSLTNMFSVPQIIKERILELNDLISEYPQTITVSACAKFLKVSDGSMRRAIIQGNIPGAFAWRQAGKDNYGFKIETLPFYLWQTQCSVSKWTIFSKMADEITEKGKKEVL